MKYLALDVETTGLEPQTCDILQIGLVIDDLAKMEPLDTLPSLRIWCKNSDHLVWNGGTIKFHMTDKKHSEGFLANWFDAVENQITATYEQAYDDIVYFLGQNGMLSTKRSVNVAGKNVGVFDLPFLQSKMPQLFDAVRISSRTIDPSLHFWRLGDIHVPSLDVCLLRAGFKDEVSHDALDDAFDIVRLVRVALMPHVKE